MNKQLWYIPLVILFGWVWLHEHDKVVLAEARVKATVDSAQAEAKSTDSLIAAMKKKDAEAAIVIAKLQNQQSIDSQKQAITESQTDSLAEQVKNQSSDTVQQVVEQLTASFERERASFRAQISSAMQANAQLQQSIVKKDSIINKLQTNVHDLNEKLASVAKISSPSTLQKVVSAIPYIAAGVLIGKAIS